MRDHLMKTDLFGAHLYRGRSRGMARTLRPLVATFFAILLVSAGAFSESQDDPQSILEEAISDFQAGRIEESVEGFDDVARLVPAFAPQLWQRGIALYYAERYQDCRAQFESHRLVNPNDVENAAWHFLCVARSESPAEALSALLPVGPDARVPMRQVYQMFAGDLGPEDVLRAGNGGTLSEFYAYLYVGLYYEAIGDGPGSLRNIQAAAADRYRGGGYMHTVARIHLDFLENQP